MKGVNKLDFTNKERRFYTVNDYYQETFHSKVFKVSLNGNFTCPNKDGSISTLGCIYCSESGSGDFAGNPKDSIEHQFQTVANVLKQKWPSGKAIAYFQANTNTYAPLPILQNLYERALACPDVVGLAIATRADCLSDDVITYLKDLSYKTHLTVELGLQTMHDASAIWLNRGHTLRVFDEAVYRLAGAKIRIVAHIINGIPNETKDMMLKTIHHLNHLPIHGVKIHMLHIMRYTLLGVMYEEHPFDMLSLEEYADVVVHQLEQMRPDLVVYRITGDAPKDLLLAPMWSLKKFVVQNEVDKRLRLRQTYQGVHYDQSR